MWSSWKQSDRLFLELTWPMHGRVKYLKKGPLGLYPTLLSTKSGWRLCYDFCGSAGTPCLSHSQNRLSWYTLASWLPHWNIKKIDVCPSPTGASSNPIFTQFHQVSRLVINPSIDRIRDGFDGVSPIIGMVVYTHHILSINLQWVMFFFRTSFQRNRGGLRCLESCRGRKPAP